MDISKLDEPNFIDRDVNNITDEIIAKYEELAGKPLYPAQADRLMVDVIAYREMMIRTAINEAAKQNLIAFANGVMLDYLGDFFGVERLDNETDEQLRNRIRLAPESYATTGSKQAYTYHALSTSADIIDVEAVRGDNGHVYIYLLTADGAPSDQLIQAVKENTSDEKKRPLSDDVHVMGGESVDIALNITVYPLSNANATNVLLNAQQKIDNYAMSLTNKLGKDVVPSQIVDLLSGEDVWQVKVNSPRSPVVVEPWQWANCSDIDISLGGVQNG